MNLNLSGLTPHRVVTARWDVATNILTEPAYWLIRSTTKDIFPSEVENLEQLASKLWVLKPENDLRIIAESNTANKPFILRLEDDYTFSPILVEVPRHRSLTELLNIGGGADLATEGDWFITKRISAGDGWDQPLSPVEAGPLANVWNYPLDPVAMAPKTGIFSADQGFLIRLLLPNSLGSNPDVVFSFRFGGEIHAKGYGKFEAFLTGDGRITLYEKRAPAAGGSPVWTLVADWQFTPYREMAASALTIRIIPHPPKWVEFRVFAGQGVDPSLVNLSDASLGENLIRASSHSVFESFPFETADRPRDVAFIGDSPFMRPITGAGGILISVRRDLRLAFQVSRIHYRASGSLTDRPFVIPGGVEDNKVARIVVRGHQPVGIGTISGELEGADGSALPGSTESFNLNGTSTTYTGRFPPGGTNKMRAVITMENSLGSGARWQTPVLEGYVVQRAVVQGTFAPGEKTGGNITNLFITGPTYQPDSETAAVTIEDPTDALAAVRTRRTPVVIESTVAANGVQKAVLFSGWTDRVTSILKGKHGQTYPNEDYRELNAELVGQWDRLANNKFTWQMIDLADMSTHPLGRGGNAKVAWPVTQAIWWVLYSSGFSESQLNIFEDSIRFFVSKDSAHEDNLKIMPGTPNIGALAVSWARRFLNAYLVWDGGAGAAGTGQWILKRPPTADTAPLCSFTLAECPAGKLPHLSASYGTLGGKPIYPILDDGTTSYRSFTEPPETNLVTVLGRVKSLPKGGRQQLWQQMINFTSARFPGRESFADPTSPDWLGDVRPIEIHDETLPNQESVSFVCRRIFEAAARGRRVHQFPAELVLADVSGIETRAATRHFRPLLPGDVVNLISMEGVATKCVVESANFSVQKAHTSLGYYEVSELRVGTTIGKGRV